MDGCFGIDRNVPEISEHLGKFKEDDTISSLTLDNEIVNKIKILAEKDGRSFSQYVNIILKNHIYDIKNKISLLTDS